MQNTARRNIAYPSADRSDRPDVPAHIGILAAALDVDVLYNIGTDAQRTAAAHQVNGGRFWWATDTKVLWFDDGSTWQLIGPTPTPAGVINQFAGSAAPSGWLLCDGSAVSRTTYAALFTAIGTAYGAGDGSSTFNVPDLRGRVPVGKNTATFAALGANGGEETHAMLVTEMPSHSHPISSDSAGTPAGTVSSVSAGTPAGTIASTFAGSALAGHSHTFTGSALAGHSHTFAGNTVPDHHHYGTTNSPADLRARFDMQSGGGSSTVINDIGGVTGVPAGTASPWWTGFVDFADSSAGVVSGSISSSSAGTPAGSISSVSAGTPAGSVTSTFTGTAMTAHNHTFAGTAMSTHTHTISNTGGGTAHNNLQPYLVVNHIIKT